MEWVRIFLFTIAVYGFSVRGAELSASECRRRAVVREVYRKLYRVITDNAICDRDKSETNVELLNIGTPLSFAKFNPKRVSRLSESEELPISVMENGLPLVDKVYPIVSAQFKAANNGSENVVEHHFDSISSVYDSILTHMMLLPQNFSDEEVLRAKYYLQELVPNQERVIRNESRLPRFMLYDYYRSDYIRQKALKEDTIDSSHNYLPQQSFEAWGQRKLSGLESDTEAAYQKWQTFGYKSEVEKQLQYFEVDTYEDKLMATRALFKSMGQPSEKNAHVTIYPFYLEPTDWYRHLSKR